MLQQITLQYFFCNYFQKEAKIPEFIQYNIKLIRIFMTEAHSLKYLMFKYKGAGDTINTTMNADELQYQHYRKGLQQEAK